VLCWGRNDYGQAGVAGSDYVDTPTPVDSIPADCQVRQVSAGAMHTCVRCSSGQAYCWGRNDFGQLGNGTNAPSHVPVQVETLSNVVQLSAGRMYTCALEQTATMKNALYCWGKNDSDQLGLWNTHGADVNTPGLVSKDIQFSFVAAGSNHTCAIGHNKQELDRPKCWGNNTAGQRGQPKTEANSAAPQDVGLPIDFPEEATFKSISVGERHSCLLTGEGTVWCWGDNTQGQLGSDEVTRPSEPNRVPTIIPPVIAVSAGGFHTCAIGGPSLSLTCWGSNTRGQLGIGGDLQEHGPKQALEICAPH
jgi:alpha-tubulin suppressor-like RCC1 family protein